MRKEALEVREKTTNPTFVDLYPPSTIPFTTLYPPFLYHIFGKGCGIKKRSGKDRRRDDYKSYLYLPFTYPLVTPDLKPTGGILGDENKKQEVRLCGDQRYR